MAPTLITVKAVIFAVDLFSRTNYNPRKYTLNCIELYYNLTPIREINNTHNFQKNQKHKNICGTVLENINSFYYSMWITVYQWLENCQSY